MVKSTQSPPADGTDDDLVGFGRRLEAVRLAFGEENNRRDLPLQEFATILGLHPKTLFELESGIIEPTVEFLTVIHDLTGISLDYLVANRDWIRRPVQERMPRRSAKRLTV